MESIIQLSVLGLAMGLLYSLAATQFTLILNTSGLLNFGWDRYILFAAFLFGGTLVRDLGLPTSVSWVLTVIIVGIMGAIIAQLVFTRMQHLRPIYAITGTMALSMMVLEATRMFYGARSFTVLGFMSGSVRVGFVSLQRVHLLVVVFATILVIAQFMFLMKTKLGRCLRAVAQDKETCRLMGVNINFMLKVSAAMSLMICAMIGVLMVPITGISLGMTLMLGAKGFMSAVVGGMGSLYGALVGGLVVGLTESLFLALGGNPIYRDVVSFGLVIAFLLLRPEGILSEAKSRI